MEISLVPIGGLCNRLNAVASGILYAQNNPQDTLSIYWYNSHDCAAYYDELFEPVPGSVNVSRTKSLLKLRPGTYRNLFIPNKLRRLFFDVPINVGSSHSNDFDQFVKGHSKIYVASDNRFCKYEITENLGKVFVPVNPIKSKITSIIQSEFSPIKTIGIHIRRTDNVKSITYSPDSLFDEAIERELLVEPRTKFLNSATL